MLEYFYTGKTVIISNYASNLKWFFNSASFIIYRIYKIYDVFIGNTPYRFLFFKAVYLTKTCYTTRNLAHLSKDPYVNRIDHFRHTYLGTIGPLDYSNGFIVYRLKTVHRNNTVQEQYVLNYFNRDSGYK